jgi:sec-independent protein translocase protein TatA
MITQPVLLFLNMGPGEIVVILLAVLMLFGAKGIPDIARNLGRGVRQVKDAAGEVQRELKKSAEKMMNDLPVNDKNSNKEDTIEDVVKEIKDDPFQKKQ